ncbi:MAG: methyltransferase domain-containing protein [Thermoleophilaceae bacterium]|nr:methyltransferase domain-containing protein [Thermoleophilaceae bacterium]
MPALDDVLRLLRCPLCGAALAREGGVVGCDEGHSFDLARQGYLSLLVGEGTAHAGDTAEMAAARERFLGGGHFDRLAGALGRAVASASPSRAGESPCIVDLGAGTGWYLARLLDRLPDAAGLALDVSKPALRRAARAHPRVAAVACDAWRPLPLDDRVAAAVLNVFAPRNGPEIARILRPGGMAVVVTPASHHLGELVGPLGLIGVDERKDERLAEQLQPDLEIAGTRELEWRLSLERAAARDAVAMGPSAFHASPAELDERVAGLSEPVEVTAAVTITLATATRG